MKNLIITFILFVTTNVFALNNIKDVITDFEAKSFDMGDVIKDKRHYRVNNGGLTILERNSQERLSFHFLFYKPNRSNLKSLVVLSPNISGVTFLEKRLAHRLAKEGYPVLIPCSLVEVIPFDEETASKIERKIRRDLAGTFFAIAGLKRQMPYLKTNKMGLVGASLGGIQSAMLYGLDHRFQALFVAVAGGDTPSLYRDTQREDLVDFRNCHMKALGITNLGEYESYLRDFLYLDPNLIINNPLVKNVAMVISDKDNVVPTRNQWILWKKIRSIGVHPKTFILEKSHVRSALELILKEKFLINWFARKL